MSGRIRPSARKKTLHNVMHSNLSITDKGCIDEVFAKFEQQKEEIEALIAGQETLQKALAEKYAENEKLTYCKFCEHYELMTSTNQHFCNKYGGYVTETDCCSRGNCKRNGG